MGDFWEKGSFSLGENFIYRHPLVAGGKKLPLTINFIKTTYTLHKRIMRPMPSDVAWHSRVIQPSYLASSPTEAISLESALEVRPKSNRKSVPGEVVEDCPCITRYRPPGAIKNPLIRIDSSENLGVTLGRSMDLGSSRSISSRLRQKLSHLRGAIAAFSSSKLLMSGMGKLGRNSAFSLITRRSAASQTTRCRVLDWRALQVLIILQWFDQQ